ncbi:MULTISPECIES: FxsA family protein [unclassified Roseibium]|uniref:FxsA family protein n=1 Tax=unclassified Roseibium TaxID=2629323 RepID=UPI000927789A|nr:MULTISPECIES: FxsA family protein [unclassified Roseibium]OJJ09652.1 FxsA protein [Alphaproteobacteria bacterium AO1-B]
MGLYIIAGIILLPLIEISVFIWVGELLGVLPTILLTVLTAMAGTLMLRQQGLSLLMRMQKELDGGRAPGNEVMQGAMIVLASILLLIPGFVTDAIGLLLFIPPVRESLAKFIIARSNVVIMEGGTMRPRNEDGVVDLDADDWKETNHGPDAGSQTSGQPRISPWNDGSEKPNS